MAIKITIVSKETQPDTQPEPEPNSEPERGRIH